jgi:hypothetical protein
MNFSGRNARGRRKFAVRRFEMRSLLLVALPLPAVAHANNRKCFGPR